MPTNDLTPNPTGSPIREPIPKPTPHPTLCLTNKPTPNLLMILKPAPVCDLDFEQSINIVFINVCDIYDDHECDDVKTFLTNIVEGSFNPNYIDCIKFLSMIYVMDHLLVIVVHH